jgi:hypothetical protein
MNLSVTEIDVPWRYVMSENFMAGQIWRYRNNCRVALLIST